MGKTVFWDLDGTLIYCDSLWSPSLHALLDAAAPGAMTLGQLRAAIAGVYTWDRPDDDNRPFAGDAWWPELFRRIAMRLAAAGVERPAAENAASGLRAEILRPEKYMIFGDAFDVLSFARGAGWRNILLTNNHPDVELLCERLGLAPLLDGYAVSGLIGYEKPRAEIFRAALDIAGNPHPQDCFMVGDNPVADIAGAKAVGMRTVLVHKRGAGADYRFDSLSPIKMLL